MLRFILLLQLISFAVVTSFMHSGTPGGVPASADCAIRKFAYEYGQKLAPQRGDFKTLYDALQLQNCDVQEPLEMDAWSPPSYPLEELKGSILYVDPAKGRDDGNGDIDLPFRTINAAVHSSRSIQKPCNIVLRSGVHFLESTIELGPNDSGLSFLNYPKEHATVSGGKPLKTNWKPSTACKGCYETDLNGQIHSLKGLRRNGIREIRARYPNFDPELDSVIDGQMLFHDGYQGWISASTSWVPKGDGMNGHSPWPPTENPTTYIIRASDWPNVEWPMTLYKSTWTGEGDWGEYWLGAGGTCLDRDPPVGYWCAPDAPRHISVPNHPSGIKPDNSHLPNLPYGNATGAVIHTWRPGHWYTNMFEVGGYDYTTINHTGWDLKMNYNNIYGRVPVPGQDAGTIKYLGEFSSIKGCQHAVNTSSKGPFHSYTWHHPDFSGDFSSQCYGDTSMYWNPTAQNKIDSGEGPRTGHTYQMNFSWGGFQGGEGVTQSEAWYIENVLDELDMGREWFFNETTKMLYYMPNGTSGSPPTGEFVATAHKILFNVVGTQDKPATHIAIKGITLQDTVYTYMDPHGLPSGGDWALQKQGAITLIGTKNILVDKCLFSRLDGNAIFIGGYNRNMTISNSEFVFIGDSAIASWGDTSYELNENKSITVDYQVGPDGRNGNQPRGTQILNNICREIGLWQKQSSFWFQAVTAQTFMKGNIFFNGPRAAVNFNDGFGGGDILTENLFVNTCRESSDHGPWNSWDRVPYITNLRHGGPSIIPADREIHHNFVIGTYNSQEQIDTDDGSAYIKTHHNFLTYADNGLKSDFGGHDHVWYNNIVAYTGNCWDMWNFFGYNDGFYGNKCLVRSGEGYKSDCNLETGWVVHSNQVYSSSGDLKACGTTLSKWLAQGHDKGTTISKWPSDEELIQWGRDLLM